MYELWRPKLCVVDNCKIFLLGKFDHACASPQLSLQCVGAGQYRSQTTQRITKAEAVLFVAV